MADIFLSYSRKDVARAEPLVRALQRDGYRVFWDPSIEPGAEFAAVLDGEIDAARLVVVLWSRHSIESEWVRREATRGQKRGLLFPVLIDNVTPPAGFEQLHAASLVGWNGTSDAADLKSLITAIQ